MAAKNLSEVYNFVNKFLNLRNNGENATLTLQCYDGGRVAITMQLHLPSSPPTGYQSQHPPRPFPRSRPNPSRLRRSARRAKDRAENAHNDTFNPLFKADVTEQVAATKAVKASTNNNTIDEEAEQVLEDHASDISHLSHRQPHQLPAEQASRAIGHDKPVDLSQCCQPPPSPPSQGEERNDGIKTEETKHAFTFEEFSDMKEIMEDLRKSIRESVRDAFKPP